MRLFVGIPLPDPLRDSIYRVVRQWRQSISGMKYVERENLHITLKFIGGVDERKAGRIASALESIPFDKIHVSVAGLGAFPDIDHPRVVWARVQDGFDEIVVLSQRIDDILAAEGVPREAREFRPHVTIGRVKRYDPRLSTLIRHHSSARFGDFYADHFVLFQSTLTPKGPIYRELRIYGVTQ